MFPIISLSFLVRLRSVIFSTPSLNKNEEPARKYLKLEKIKKQLVQLYKTADTENYSTHPFETSPPPPPPPGCLEVARLLNSPLTTHPFETTGGGGGAYLERVCPSPFPSRSRNPSIRDNPLQMTSVPLFIKPFSHKPTSYIGIALNLILGRHTHPVFITYTRNSVYSTFLDPLQ